MQEKLKKYSLVLCLFVFLLVIIGGGLHPSPGGAFVAALSGTPLVIFASNRRSSAAFEPEHIHQSRSADKRTENCKSGKRKAIVVGLWHENRGISVCGSTAAERIRDEGCK